MAHGKMGISSSAREKTSIFDTYLIPFHPFLSNLSLSTGHGCLSIGGRCGCFSVSL